MQNLTGHCQVVAKPADGGTAGRPRDQGGEDREADTILRWHRQLSAQVDLPATPRETPGFGKIEQLTIRIANENSRWGYTRIQGVLHNVGHHVARSKIAKILSWLPALLNDW